jgi:hypothetical protein
MIAAASTWTTPRQALRLTCERSTLRKTVPIAVVVGTILSLINQADIIATGESSWATWLRVAANYAVPFCVSSAGFLSASRAAPDARANRTE